MRNQPGKLGDESLFGQSHGFLEASSNPGFLLLVDGGVELEKIISGLDVGELPRQIEESA